MGVTRAEQETIFRWDEEEQVVHVSASPRAWRKMARLGLEPRKITTTKGEPTGKCWDIPLADFRWRLKAARKGNVAALQAARKAREAS